MQPFLAQRLLAFATLWRLQCGLGREVVVRGDEIRQFSNRAFTPKGTYNLGMASVWQACSWVASQVDQPSGRTFRIRQGTRCGGQNIFGDLADITNCQHGAPQILY